MEEERKRKEEEDRIERERLEEEARIRKEEEEAKKRSGVYPDKGFSKEQNVVMHDLGEVLVKTIADTTTLKYSDGQVGSRSSTKDVEKYESNLEKIEEKYAELIGELGGDADVLGRDAVDGDKFDEDASVYEGV